jgi:probable HAF family extracellular repeat protein
MLHALIIAAALAAVGVSASAAPTYRITDLGALADGDNFSTASGINSRGQVVGASSVEAGATLHAFIWQGGVMTDLGVLSGQGDSFASAINVHGQVVGSSGPAAFLWQNGVMGELAPLSGAPDALALGINAGGQIVGNSGNFGVIWQNGVASDLGRLPGGNPDFPTVANFINDAGQVAGYSFVATGRHAFFWQNGVMTDLGDLPGGADFSSASGINSLGEVVGTSATVGGRHAVVWRNGAMIDLGGLAGSTRTQAIANNDRGQIVGFSVVAGSDHAMLWQDGLILDLNDLVDPLDPLRAASDLTDAFAINNDGTIVGEATIDGATHAFLLTPVPEPSTIALMSLGIGVLLARRRRTAALAQRSLGPA